MIVRTFILPLLALLISVASFSNSKMIEVELETLFFIGESGELYKNSPNSGSEVLFDEARFTMLSASTSSDDNGNVNFHLLALDDRGNVWGLGNNNHRQLGAIASSDRPQIIPGLNNIVEVAAGNTFSLALDTEGRVWSMGIRDETVHNTPTPIDLPPLKKIVAGHQHVLALARDGHVWVCGDNHNGQLGCADQEIIQEFLELEYPRNISDIATSGGGTLFLDENKQVWITGYHDQNIPRLTEYEADQIYANSYTWALTRKHTETIICEVKPTSNTVAYSNPKISYHAPCNVHIVGRELYLEIDGQWQKHNRDLDPVEKASLLMFKSPSKVKKASQE